jgi:putative SOS response-associated peptidase YedK
LRTKTRSVAEARKSDKQKIAEAFHVSKVDDFSLPPWDYNVAPTTMQPIIRANRDTGERELVQSRFGSDSLLY